MKKQLFSLIVISLVCVGVAQARFYIGIEGGYTGGAYDSKDHNIQTGSSYFLIPGGNTLKNTFKDKTYYGSNGFAEEVEPWKGFNVALNLGSEHFFAHNYFGVRWGASLGFTEIMQDVTQREATGSLTYTDSLGYIDTGLSFDVMINFVSRSNFSFGIFGGIEGDYHYLVIADREVSKTTKSFLSTVESRHSINLLGRVGFSTLLGRHHRFDLSAKLPIGYVVAGEDDKVKISAENPVKTSFNFSYKYIF